MFTKFLISKSVNIHNYEEKLIKYIRNKNIKKMKRLIDCGIDITFNDNQAIRTCAIWNFNNGIELLLKAGADPRTVINIALKHQNLDMINLFIKYGWNVQDNDNEAIIYACGACKVEIVQALIDAGADIKANDNQALKNACQYKSNETIKVLIDLGADMYADNHSCIKTSLLLDNKDAINIFVKSGYVANAEIISFAQICHCKEEIINLLKSTI